MSKCRLRTSGALQREEMIFGLIFWLRYCYMDKEIANFKFNVLVLQIHGQIKMIKGFYYLLIFDRLSLSLPNKLSASARLKSITHQTAFKIRIAA